MELAPGGEGCPFAKERVLIETAIYEVDCTRDPG